MNKKFWESLTKNSSGISRDNIEICSTLKIIFINYYNMAKDILKEKGKIRKAKKQTYKKGTFAPQIDKIIKEYIENINNKDIIELILDCDEYYKNTTYTQLEKAVSGKDEKTIVNITLNHSLEECIKLTDEYQVKYGRDLLKDFEDKFGSEFRTHLIGLFQTPEEYDAYLLYTAIKGIGSDKELIADVFASVVPIE